MMQLHSQGQCPESVGDRERVERAWLIMGAGIKPTRSADPLADMLRSWITRQELAT